VFGALTAAYLNPVEISAAAPVAASRALAGTRRMNVLLSELRSLGPGRLSRKLNPRCSSAHCRTTIGDVSTEHVHQITDNLAACFRIERQPTTVILD
jgi:hypothetical protein